MATGADGMWRRFTGERMMLIDSLRLAICCYPSFFVQNYSSRIILGSFLLISSYSLVFVQKILGPKFFVRFPINTDRNNNHRLLKSLLFIINQCIMSWWSIFDSHHIIKYPLLIVIHRKNFYVEIFLYGFLLITVLTNGIAY